jgi:hypothetical protein
MEFFTEEWGGDDAPPLEAFQLIWELLGLERWSLKTDF